MTRNNPAICRVAPNSSVRRRLFSEDDATDLARIDNSANVLQETMAREKEEKKLKWGFDFTNDRPLEGGTYTWSLAEGPYDWVGKMAATKTDDEKAEGEDFLRLRKENEETPKSKEEESVPPGIRKRKKEGEVEVREARRKISFD